MNKWLEGKKTHIAAVAGMVAALALLYFGFMTVDAAVEITIGCLLAMGFRSALAGPVIRKIAEVIAEQGAARRNPPGVKTLPPAPGAGGATN